MNNRKRKIFVRKHMRHVPSGKIVPVRKHKRMILQKQKRRSPEVIQKERRKTFRDKARREWIYPFKNAEFIDPNMLSDEQYQFTSGEQGSGKGLDQTEAQREFQLISKARTGKMRTEIGINARLEDRLSEKTLQSYLLLTKEIPKTDSEGNILYDENNNPIMETTQLVLPPLPVPGKLDPNEIFEIQKIDSGGGYVIDSDGKFTFKRILGLDTEKTIEQLSKELLEIDEKTPEYFEILDKINALRQGKEWVIVDRNGMPILADHVSVYAIKGVDAQVGDMLRKKGIYTVHDYMNWRRQLADKKLKDKESGIIYNLIETIDEYNQETVRDKINALIKMQLNLSGKDFKGRKYSDLVQEEVEKTIKQRQAEMDDTITPDQKAIQWVNAMENAIAKISLKKEKEDNIRASKRIHRDKVGGRPVSIINEPLEKKKQYYINIIKKKKSHGKSTKIERKYLNDINFNLQKNKIYNTIKKAEQKYNLDDLGKFLIASGAVIPPDKKYSISNPRFKYNYNKARKKALNDIKKHGYTTVNNIRYYPKITTAHELGLPNTQPPKTQKELILNADIYVTDKPKQAKQSNWRYASLLEPNSFDPNNFISKKYKAVYFDNKLWNKTSKKNAGPNSVLKSRKQILRSGVSYYNKNDLAKIYGYTETINKGFKIANQAGFENQSYVVRSELADQKNSNKENDLFIGKPLIFETTKSFITINPTVSHYNNFHPKVEDYLKKIKKEKKKK